jgi:L-asparaginase/Glu-tRNA(Gln) amidotransferase subunit D
MGAPPASLGGASGEVALVTLRSGDHAVVVAGHGAGHGLVEGEVAIGDVQRRTVVVAAHQQVEHLDYQLLDAAHHLSDHGAAAVVAGSGRQVQG